MSNLDLASFVENLLAGWFGHDDAQITPGAIQDAATDAGYDPKDLQNLDMKQIYQAACEHPGVPADYKAAADNYNGPNSYDNVVRQIQQVTEVHNTQQFYDNSTNVDNSIDLAGANVNGGLDIDNNPITADDGGVAAGGNVDGVATGDHSNATGHGDINQNSGQGNIVDGDNYGQVNSGDHAGLVDQGTVVTEQGGLIEPVRTPLGGDDLIHSPFGAGATDGFNGLGQVQVPQPAHSPVILNTGDGDQQVAQAYGDGNQTNFGPGDNTNLAGAQVTDSAVGHDGVGNFQGNEFDHSQVGVAGGDQSQGYEDDSTHTHTNIDDSPYSTVNNESGDGDLDASHHTVHPDHIVHPI